MTPGRVASINVSAGGVPKRARDRARIGPEGVEGDRQQDRRFHGGPQRAVSLYSLELIEALRAEGHPIVPGSIGENLTLSGVDWRDMRPGAHVHIGDAELELTGFASPCQKIANAFRDRQFTRVSEKVHPGWSRAYARVLSEGNAAIGDEAAATQAYVIQLLGSVEAALPRLRSLTSDETQQRPAPGKWSPREIIGHLIDSTSNNHQRFVRAHVEHRRVFEGYAQDAWVEKQRYQEAPWDELLALWAVFNRHLARVMAATPPAVRHESIEPNNLAELAMAVGAAAGPPTLDAFMRDYVEHLKHHLRQVIGE